MDRTGKRGYKIWETLIISIGACASLLAVTPVVSFAVQHPDPSLQRTGGFELDMNNLPLIPGMAYSLAEVECRSWRRNRSTRPFNFLLRQ